MRLHCIAKEVRQPENEAELIDLVKQFVKEKHRFYVLGACSNVILPRRLDIPVILLTAFNKDVIIDEGIIEAGASVRVQHLIREAQRRELGGIEYLFSVPCTVGGATVMNAGRGNKNQSIGNYIEKVKVLDVETLEIKTYNKEQCCFDYRKSVFLHGKDIVLSTTLRLEKKTREEIEKDIESRKQYALEYLDDRRPSCGSIFKAFNGRIMKMMRGVRLGGAEWSSKTNNWISNRGNAKNWQVRYLIGFACFLHRITFKPYHLEVEIWKQ